MHGQHDIDGSRAVLSDRIPAPVDILTLSAMVEREGFCQAGAIAANWVTQLRRCKPIWRHWSGTDDAENVIHSSMLTKLPDDVLHLVLQHVDFQGKCKMQLVCRKFSALLSSPSPGLWGELNLVTDIMNRGQKDRISGQVPKNPTLLRML